MLLVLQALDLKDFAVLRCEVVKVLLVVFRAYLMNACSAAWGQLVTSI